jgi:hypothetical protein
MDLREPSDTGCDAGESVTPVPVVGGNLVVLDRSERLRRPACSHSALLGSSRRSLKNAREALSGRRPDERSALMNRKRMWVTVGAVVAAAGLVAGCSTSSPSATTSASASTGAHRGPAGGAGGGSGSNARSGPAEGGAVGTVDSVTSAGFTMTTVAKQKVTVKASSSTTYLNGTSKTSASAVTIGTTVLALGTTSSTTITATQVVVQVGDGGGAATSTAAGVVPFQRGAKSAAKQDGQIPANYTEGEGTIVSGSTADKATEAALAAYPGGVVDRVVKLSSGEYEVHYIGVNWPHHIFVGGTFKVVGAN